MCFKSLTNDFCLINAILLYLKSRLRNSSSHEISKAGFLFICDREGIRTPNPQSRNLIFYPVELRSQVLISLEKATINKIKIINDCQFRCQMITQS